MALARVRCQALVAAVVRGDRPTWGWPLDTATKAKVRATPPGWTAVRPTETYEPQAVTEV